MQCRSAAISGGTGCCINHHGEEETSDFRPSSNFAELRLVLDKRAFCDQQGQGGPVCCKWESAAEMHRREAVPDRILTGFAGFAKKLLAQ
jgi:hypothetical protein